MAGAALGALGAEHDQGARESRKGHLTTHFRVCICAAHDERCAIVHGNLICYSKKAVVLFGGAGAEDIVEKIASKNWREKDATLLALLAPWITAGDC